GYRGPFLAPGDIGGPASILVPPFNDIPVPFTQTGIVLNPGVPYRVTVSGTIRFSPNPGYGACIANGAGPPLPTLVPNPVGPAGLQNFPGRYAVVVGRGTAGDPPSSAIPFQNQSAASMAGFVDGPGVLWAARPAVLPNACGNETGHNPGWILSGNQNVQAEELEPPSITVDETRVTVGDTARAELVMPSWVTSFFVLTGWVWVPEPGSTATARFIEGCSRTSSFCRAEIGGAGGGHFEVRDIGVNGAMFLTARSPVIQVGARELRVELSVTPGVVSPVLIQRFDAVNQTAVLRNGQNAARTDVVQVRVRAFYHPSGDPAAGAEATLRAVGRDGSGGHDHATNPGITRPNGTFFQLGDDTAAPGGGMRNQITFTLPASGDSTLLYRTSGLGGIEDLAVEVSSGSDHASDVGQVSIRFPNLVPFAQSGTGYTFESSRNHSTGDNYVTASALAVMGPLWTDFIERTQRTPGHRYRMNGDVFILTAAALESGGLYDIGGTWAAPNHYTHRTGTDIDFDDADVGGQTEVERDPQLMERHCARFRFGARPIRCQLHDGSHYHAFLAPTPP
ncbi:MAG: hypothetical protein ACREN5_07320, partial [Gemmatimonadales bacterium]